MVLASLKSWDRYYNLCFTLTALFSGLSGPPCGDADAQLSFKDYLVSEAIWNCGANVHDHSCIFYDYTVPGEWCIQVLLLAQSWVWLLRSKAVIVFVWWLRWNTFLGSSFPRIVNTFVNLSFGSLFSNKLLLIFFFTMVSFLPSERESYSLSVKHCFSLKMSASTTAFILTVTLNLVETIFPRICTLFISLCSTYCSLAL